jgi:hypothetical protein
MKKEELRPIEITLYRKISNGNDSLDDLIYDYIKEPYKVLGYFHGFITYKDPVASTNYALVELETGEVKEVSVTDIRFTDRVSMD